METTWQWGLDLIHTIQLIHGPTLDVVFKAITFMGEEEFFMILLSLILWCVDFAVGARLGIALLLSAYANEGLKDLFAHPRPFELDPLVQLHDVGVEGYGLPSGHSQSAVVVWGVIASEFRKAWLWVVAILLMVLIGFSRIYLGVHFPTDVLGGWAFGAICLAAYLAWGSRVEAWLGKISLATQLALTVVVPLVLLFHSTGNTTSLMGLLMGIGMGMVLVKQVAPFSTAGPLWQRAMRFPVGLTGLLVVYLGLKFVFPGEGEPLYLALRIVRYALVGLWGTLGAPWLFQKLRLASPA